MSDDSTQAPPTPVAPDQAPAAAAEPPGRADLLAPVDLAAHLAPATPAAPDLRVVAASVVGHLLLLVLVAGSIFSIAPPPPVIPIHFVPADEAPPEKKPPEQAAEDAKPADPETPTKASEQTPSKPTESGQAAETAPSEDGAAGKTTPPPAPAAGSFGFADFSLPPPLSPGLLATVRSQIEPCWSAPTGWSDPRQAAVTVRFRLNRDGTLAGEPAVVEFRASPLGKAAADSAIAAIMRCAPFKLPPAEYDRWSDIQLELAP